MSKLSKKDKKKLLKEYLLESEKPLQYKLLLDFKIKKNLMNSFEPLEFVYDDFKNITICQNYSLRIANIRADGDIRNQSDFAICIYQDDLKILYMRYTYSISKRLVECLKPIFFSSSKSYSDDELVYVALSYLQRLHNCAL